MSPESLAFFWNPSFANHSILYHHFTLGNWCKCILCINRLCLCVNVQFDLFSTHPNWFVGYPSRPVGFMFQSSIVQMQSPGPTNAFAHIAADQIESWSNPAGTFWRFAVGRLAIWWIDRTNYQPDTDTFMRLSLSLSVSLMSTTSDAQQRKWGHMMISYVEITCQHHTFPACTVHTFLDFRFETVLLLVRGALYARMQHDLCKHIHVLMRLHTIKTQLGSDSALQNGATKWEVVLIFLMQDVKERTEKNGDADRWIIMSHESDICSSTSKCKRSWLAFSVLPIVLTKKSFF